MFRIAPLFLLAALAGLPHDAGAQSAPDTLPFHAGQWAAQYFHGVPYRSMGLVRFVSPRYAIVFDGMARSNSLQSRDVNSQLVQEESSRFRLGMRWHRATLPSVHQFITVGAEVGWGHAMTEVSDATTGNLLYRSENRSRDVGGFANVGSAWMVTPHLSLAAAWEASAVHRQSLPRSLGTSRSVELGRAYMIATLYF